MLLITHCRIERHHGPNSEQPDIHPPFTWLSRLSPDHSVSQVYAPSQRDKRCAVALISTCYGISILEHRGSAVLLFKYQFGVYYEVCHSYDMHRGPTSHHKNSASEGIVWEAGLVCGSHKLRWMSRRILRAHPGVCAVQ